MAFNMKNVPQTYQKNVSIAFKEYFDNFIKWFIDDFNVYNDIKTHLLELQLCFNKCWEFSINLNPTKLILLIYFGIIFNYIVSKEKKLSNPKNICTIVQMLPPNNPKDIQVSMKWHSSIDISSIILHLWWHQLGLRFRALIESFLMTLQGGYHWLLSRIKSQIFHHKIVLKKK